MDDFSNDDTPNVINSLKFSDPRILSFKSSNNIGPGAARNLGIKSARGEFIAIMDDDDVSHPDRFQKQLDVFNEHPEVGLVFSAVRWVDSFGKEIGEFPGILLKGNFPNHPDEVFKLLYLNNNKIPNPSIMMRREIFSTFEYPITPWVGEDWFLMMQLAASGIQFFAIPESLVDMRRELTHPSLMKNRNYVTKSQRQVLKLIKKWLRKQKISAFDSIHKRAIINQIVREATIFSGIRGLLMVSWAIILDNNNLNAKQAFNQLLMKAYNKVVRLLKISSPV